MNTETLFQTCEDHDLILVTAHSRALPGEAGSDFKPIAVREHLRRVFRDGRKAERVKLNFKWAPGCLSPELIDSMAQVTELRIPKTHIKTTTWTLEVANLVLNGGLVPIGHDRFKFSGFFGGRRRRQFYSFNNVTLEEFKKIRGQRRAEARSRRAAAAQRHRAYKQGANVDTWRA